MRVLIYSGPRPVHLLKSGAWLEPGRNELTDDAAEAILKSGLSVREVFEGESKEKPEANINDSGDSPSFARKKKKAVKKGGAE